MLSMLSIDNLSFLGQHKSHNVKCQQTKSKEEIIQTTDDGNVENDLLDSPPIFDEYHDDDDCQEENLENQYFDQDPIEQVVITECQFMRKPVWNVLMVKATSELVLKQERKPQVLTLESHL